MNSGGIKPLVELLGMGYGEHQTYVAGALANIAYNPEFKNHVMESGATLLLIDMLEKSSPLATNNAAACINNLVANNVENQSKVVASGAIRPLLKVVREAIGVQKLKVETFAEFKTHLFFFGGEGDCIYSEKMHLTSNL